MLFRKDFHHLLLKRLRFSPDLGFSINYAVCLSVLKTIPTELAHYIPRDFYFLFAPFIALSLCKAKININYLIAGAKVSLLVLGGIIIYFGGGTVKDHKSWSVW